MVRWGKAEMGRWGKVEMARWGRAEMVRWGKVEMARREEAVMGGRGEAVTGCGGGRDGSISMYSYIPVLYTRKEYLLRRSSLLIMGNNYTGVLYM
jgi:hypothetical protein